MGAKLMLEESVWSLEEDAMKVELDKKSLFALASDTRVEILRSLQPMRRTVSQLSESLDIDKAAVHRHLKKMEEGGLVKRFEEHGFVYYGLSWKARDLLMPNENTKIVVLLSAAWIFIGFVALLLILAYVVHSSSPLEPGKGASGGDTHYAEQLISSHPGFTSLGWIALFSFAACAGAAGIFGVRKHLRPRQGSPEKSKGIEGGREKLGDD